MRLGEIDANALTRYFSKAHSVVYAVIRKRSVENAGKTFEEV